MANYAKMAREAAERRRTLESDLVRARKTVKECEKELEVLGQILGALKGVGKVAAPAGRGGRRRKGGKWRPGKPGRPPKWYVEKQKAAGKKPAKRRTRRAPKSAPAAVEAPPAQA